MMRRSRTKSNSAPSFEMLSDLSLSTLGLFAIIFVVYSLLFNSRNAVQVRKAFEQSQNIEKLENQNSNLITERDGALKRAEKAEDDLKEVLQRNRYTGYYTGKGTGRLYSTYSCEGNYTIVRQNYSLFFVQDSNLAILTTKTSKGTTNFRYRGSLSGNQFTSSNNNREFLGSERVKPCDDSGPFVLEFHDDYLKMGGTRLDRVE